MDRKQITGALLGATLLWGCGDGSTADIEAEPPGENCPDGGIRITTDDETYYACNGDASDVTTEQVSAFDPDNPCDTNAVRITITRPGTEPSVEYVCQDLGDPVVPELEQYFVLESESQKEWELVECVCEDEVELDECEASVYELHELRTNFVRRCTNEAAVLTGRAPSPGVAAYFECLSEPFEEALACREPVDLETCDPDTLSTAQECLGDIAAPDCESMLEEEDILWLDAWDSLGSQLGCFVR
ncbi:MAG: hypothetical protein ACODAU_02055 [Myxococcota bacterium]